MRNPKNQEIRKPAQRCTVCKWQPGTLTNAEVYTAGIWRKSMKALNRKFIGALSDFTSSNGMPKSFVVRDNGEESASILEVIPV